MSFVRAAVETTVDAPTSLPGLLLQRASKPEQAAATHRVDGLWVQVSWGEILDEVRRLQAGLDALGVKPGERVALFAATSLRWAICDLAISSAHAITVPIYPSSTPEELRYVLAHSESVLAFVDEPGRASRLAAIRSGCPALRVVVRMDEQPIGQEEHSYLRVLERGDKVSKDAFAQRVAALRADDVHSIVYTSGTTGEPKGALLTHGNWAFEGSALSHFRVMRPDDSVLLFLPLAHAFAQVVKAAWLGLGFRLDFTESADRLLQDVVELRPSILPAVPRVFEKLYNGVLAQGTRAPGLSGWLFRKALAQFDRYAESRLAGREHRSLGLELARRLVFGKLRRTLDIRLGGRLRLFISGGAPLSKKIALFFELLGYEILEGYGLTETSAASTVNPPGRARLGTVGPALPGVELRIASDGEVLIRGPHVMRGYFKNPRATAEALSDDGWLRTGDIGALDADGYLCITDRKKDLLVTAGGKNVAPQPLENALKASALISHALVCGDRRPYLTALITVSEEAARARLGGDAHRSYAELARAPQIREAVQMEINALNQTLPSYSTLKRFAVLEADFSQETGELTPSLKVKRKFCTQKYQQVLATLYDGAPTPE